jgi:hypothetical protein
MMQIWLFDDTILVVTFFASPSQWSYYKGRVKLPVGDQDETVDGELEYVCGHNQSSDLEPEGDVDPEGNSSEAQEPGVVVCTKRLRPPVFPVGNPASASTATGPTVHATTTGEALGIATFTNNLEADLPTLIRMPHGLVTVSVHLEDLGAGLQRGVPIALAGFVVALNVVFGAFCLM